MLKPTKRAVGRDSCRSVQCTKDRKSIDVSWSKLGKVISMSLGVTSHASVKARKTCSVISIADDRMRMQSKCRLRSIFIDDLVLRAETDTVLPSTMTEMTPLYSWSDVLIRWRKVSNTNCINPFCFHNRVPTATHHGNWDVRWRMCFRMHSSQITVVFRVDSPRSYAVNTIFISPTRNESHAVSTLADTL